MKQRLAAATLALLMVGAFGVGVVSAHDGSGHRGDTLPGTPTTHPWTSEGTVSYSARCTPAHPGGSIKVRAKVRHATRGTTFTATAAAAFTSPSASVDLHQRGKSFVAVGKIPVPADQVAGPVTVTVTITYDGTPTVLTCTSQISPADTHPADTHPADHDVSAVFSPHACRPE
jgi:hypothetical protein